MVDHKASDVDVIGVDLLCEWNAQKHSTERYQWQDKSKIVARRGFPVQVRLKTARTFEPLNHALYIEMVIDNDNTHDRPESHKKLRLETEDVFTDAKREWSAKLDRIEGQRLFATITIPVNAAVGFWEIRVHTGTWSAYKQIVDERISTFNKSRRGDSCGIYVIFNVLNNGDTVFMENKDQRDLLLNRTQEYTYSGFAKGSTGYGYSASSWEHSQFDENTMKATMTIFKKLVQPAEIQATLPILKRDNIVEVSRKLSYGINAFLLYGKWEGSFKDGTHPAEWNGSALIMAEFLRTGLRVRYAQCFTFASIFVTIMRCLGVPSRTVTCIRSAHDTDHSLTIDLITINGKRADGQSESIWNFHVWTEIWCRRIDLPVGFDGWQVVDATPQEESDGVYQCGPMPVEAIKTGRLGDIAYDAWFIYGEVNADIVMWFYKAGEQEPYDFAVNMNDAGRALLTVNAPGIIEPLNITTNYKEPESSENERSVHMQALREVRIAEREDKFRRLYANGYTPPIEDVVLAIPDIERINYGSKILLSVNLENKTSMNRTVDLTACLSAEDHKGKVVFQVKEYKMTQHLVTNQKEKLTFTVSSSDYIRQIVENQIMSFAVSVLVRETNQMTHVEDKFQITGMAISFEKVPSRAAVQEVLPVAFYFRNPLNVPLRNVELFLHSGLHSKPMKIKRFPSSVEANGKVRIRCKVRAVTQGERSILATLNCGQLHAMTIARSILVAPN